MIDARVRVGACVRVRACVRVARGRGYREGDRVGGTGRGYISGVADDGGAARLLEAVVVALLEVLGFHHGLLVLAVTCTCPTRVGVET